MPFELHENQIITFVLVEPAFQCLQNISTIVSCVVDHINYHLGTLVGTLVQISEALAQVAPGEDPDIVVKWFHHLQYV